MEKSIWHRKPTQILRLILAVAFVYLLWYRIAGLPGQEMADTGSKASFRGLPGRTSDNPFHDIGNWLAQHDYVAEAIPFLEQACLLTPDSLSVLFHLAQAYEKRDRHDQAMAIYEEVVRLDPQGKIEFSLFALEKLGNLYTRHDRLPESRSAYEAALRRETREKWIARITNQLAELDLTEGHYNDDGNTIYSDKGEVIGGVGPGDMRTNHSFEIARHTSDWKKKKIYFAKATESDPGMYQAYFDVGLALVNQERFAQAIPWFKKSNEVWQTRLDLNPKRLEKASAFAYLGRCYLETGAPQQALQHCDRAIAIDESYFYSYLFKARTLNALNRPGEALVILRDLLLENPGEPTIIAAMLSAYRSPNYTESKKGATFAAFEHLTLGTK